MMLQGHNKIRPSGQHVDPKLLTKRPEDRHNPLKVGVRSSYINRTLKPKTIQLQSLQKIPESIEDDTSHKKRKTKLYNCSMADLDFNNNNNMRNRISNRDFSPNKRSFSHNPVNTILNLKARVTSTQNSARFSNKNLAEFNLNSHSVIKNQNLQNNSDDREAKKNLSLIGNSIIDKGLKNVPNGRIGPINSRQSRNRKTIRIIQQPQKHGNEHSDRKSHYNNTGMVINNSNEYVTNKSKSIVFNDIKKSSEKPSPKNSPLNAQHAIRYSNKENNDKQSGVVSSDNKIIPINSRRLANNDVSKTTKKDNRFSNRNVSISKIKDLDPTNEKPEKKANLNQNPITNNNNSPDEKNPDLPRQSNRIAPVAEINNNKVSLTNEKLDPEFIKEQVDGLVPEVKLRYRQNRLKVKDKDKDKWNYDNDNVALGIKISILMEYYKSLQNEEEKIIDDNLNKFVVKNHVETGNIVDSIQELLSNDMIVKFAKNIRKKNLYMLFRTMSKYKNHKRLDLIKFCDNLIDKPDRLKEELEYFDNRPKYSLYVKISIIVLLVVVITLFIIYY